MPAKGLDDFSIRPGKGKTRKAVLFDLPPLFASQGLWVSFFHDTLPGMKGHSEVRKGMIYRDQGLLRLYGNPQLFMNRPLQGLLQGFPRGLFTTGEFPETSEKALRGPLDNE